MRVFVVGARGQVGHRVVEGLAARGVAVRAGTRTPSPAPSSGARVESVAFDFDRPETFEPALRGVDRVFLMARTGELQADRVGIPLIEAMRRAGVRHVVNLTGMGVERHDELPLRKLERFLESSGLAFTHLRPNHFMQNFCRPPRLEDVRVRRTLSEPIGEAAISFIDARDIAAVAVEALGSDRHLGRAYTLTGGAALTHEEVARAISEATGMTVRSIAISEAQARQALVDAGVPAALIDRRLGFLELARSGALASVSPEVERVLGRPPITFAAFARDSASTWTEVAR